jgi:hypothetical protein
VKFLFLFLRSKQHKEKFSYKNPILWNSLKFPVFQTIPQNFPTLAYVWVSTHKIFNFNGSVYMATWVGHTSKKLLPPLLDIFVNVALMVPMHYVWALPHHYLLTPARHVFFSPLYLCACFLPFHRCPGRQESETFTLL